MFDGEGREWEAVLERSDPRGAEVVLGPERTDRVEPPIEVTLVQALCRPERLEWVLQKGCEVGIFRFVLLQGARSEGPAPSPSRRERWEKILAEACKQSGRRRIPQLDGPVTERPAVPTGVRGIALHPGAPPLGGVLRDRPPGGVALAVGPEGGFSEEERDAWRAAGWIDASLGPRILRTETAGVIAAALVLHAWGDVGRA